MDPYYAGLETAVNLVLCYIDEFCENEPGYFETLEILEGIAEKEGLNI